MRGNGARDAWPERLPFAGYTSRYGGLAQLPSLAISAISGGISLAVLGRGILVASLEVAGVKDVLDLIRTM